MKYKYREQTIKEEEEILEIPDNAIGITVSKDCVRFGDFKSINYVTVCYLEPTDEEVKDIKQKREEAIERFMENERSYNHP